MGRIQKIQKHLTTSALLLLLVLATPALAATQPIHLDVGIITFDQNIPDDWSKHSKKVIYPAVRKAESIYLAFMLKDTLVKTGQWGIARVIPRTSEIFDVQVQGKILLSDGERLSLQISVFDASKRRWFKRTYKTKANSYHYGRTQIKRQDPFQPLFDKIVADINNYKNKKKAKYLSNLREISRIRYAISLSPGAFSGYLKGKKKLKLVRLVAKDDPHYNLIEDIKKREHLFADTMDTRYRDFVAQSKRDYTEWRQLSYHEVIERRRLRRKSVLEGILGIASIVGAVAAAGDASTGSRILSDVAVLSGVGLIASSADAGKEARIRTETLNDIADSFLTDTEDVIFETEDMEILLSGTLDEQYVQLRSALKDIYLEERAVSQ